MKTSKFGLKFIKTKFDTCPIIDIYGERYIIEWFKDNILKYVGTDITDILYNDEINSLNIENLELGTYILQGYLYIMFLGEETDFEFHDLRIKKE